MPRIRPMRELGVFVDQFTNDSIHLENDVFENLPTTRRDGPPIAFVI